MTLLLYARLYKLYSGEFMPKIGDTVKPKNIHFSFLVSGFFFRSEENTGDVYSQWLKHVI